MPGGVPEGTPPSSPFAPPPVAWTGGGAPDLAFISRNRPSPEARGDENAQGIPCRPPPRPHGDAARAHRVPLAHHRAGPGDPRRAARVPDPDPPSPFQGRDRARRGATTGAAQARTPK